MKITALSLTAGVIALALAACGNDDTPVAPPVTTTVTETVTKTATATETVTRTANPAPAFNLPTPAEPTSATVYALVFNATPDYSWGTGSTTEEALQNAGWRGEDGTNGYAVNNGYVAAAYSVINALGNGSGPYGGQGNSENAARNAAVTKCQKKEGGYCNAFAVFGPGMNEPKH